MALFESKSQSVSAWASVVHTGHLDPLPAEPTSGLAAVLLQGAAEQRAQNLNGWFDVEYINFSADTMKFINITEGDIRTGLRHQTHAVGKLLYTFGATKEEFIFADPVEDIVKIKKGIIQKLRPVTEPEIHMMLKGAGVFDYQKKTAHTPLANRWDFIKAEGIGGGRLDFSLTGITKIAQRLLDKDGRDISPLIFYVEGVAHNWFNFGNFLFGAAGATLGFTRVELLGGAQYNSLFGGEDNNGYPSQMDSPDDQLSIGLGFEYATARNYAAWVVRPWGAPRKG